MNICFIYYRNACSNAGDRSIARQLSMCETYAAHTRMTVAGIWGDPRTSGMHCRRAGLSALMKASQRDRPKALVVDDLCRLSRSMPQLVEFSKELQKLGVELHQAGPCGGVPFQVPHCAVVGTRSRLLVIQGGRRPPAQAGRC